MQHPDAHVIRALLAEPAGVPDADRAHVAACPQCLSALAAASDVPGSGPAAAAGPTTPPGPPRLRAALRRPVVAVLAVGVVVAGGATAAATSWLPIFRTETVAPVAFDAEDLVALPDLDAFGDVEVTGDGDPYPVADAVAAAAATGLDVPRVTALPRGVGGDPVHHVVGEVSATLTFSGARAGGAAAGSGTTSPPTPPGLDGAQVRVVAGPGTAQVWSGAAGTPTLVVGRAVAPSASATGVPFATARDHVLALSGLPADVTAQLRTFTGDGSTLPLPVPADRVTTSATEVDGSPATVLATRDRTVAAVVWVEDGVVTVVAGALDADEVLAIARDLG